MVPLLKRALDDGVFEVTEKIELVARPARNLPIPEFLSKTPIGNWLHANPKLSGGLWHHQNIALEEFSTGANVCIATGTASGKSLIFQAAALHTTITLKGRVLVLYPVKALIADQLQSWRQITRDLGLPANAVARITGGIPTGERLALLEHAKIVLMTPDACHAWLMYNLASPVVRNFLRDLRLVILDEAHTLEGVFGSNFAYLFRRLHSARQIINPDRQIAEADRVIAATATITSPAEHLEKLTGLPFKAIGPEHDGSPQSQRTLVHISTPEKEALRTARRIHLDVLKQTQSGAMITFIDSRKGVEAFASAVGHALTDDDAPPSNTADEPSGETADTDIKILAQGLPGLIAAYRAGYEESDREEIEKRLRDGSLRAVVSTSALELGIDIPHLTAGISVGVPPSRKSFRQRFGRIGRTQEGIFIVLAPETAFRRFGTSFRDYYEASVEPSYLYLDNRFMQFAHARCLLVELEALGVKSPPLSVIWPDGFPTHFDMARAGASRHREFDAIALIGGDSPQHNYPLRNVGEPNYDVRLNQSPDGRLGQVNLSQALRECYPGAIYLYRMAPYRVNQWATTGHLSGVRVRRERYGIFTKPRIATWVNAQLDAGSIVDGHYRSVAAEAGLGTSFMAECQMAITEKVEGFTESVSGKEAYRAYKDLQASNPAMRARSREFRTTGVLLRLDVADFRSAALRRAFADRLRDLYCHEFSVLPRDIGVAVSGISIATSTGDRVRDNCIAIYDETYGSLRLTERMYSRFEKLLERFKAALDAGVEFWKPEDISPGISALLDHLGKFTQAATDAGTLSLSPEIIMQGGSLRVFSPGSIVQFWENPLVATDVEVIKPVYVPGTGEQGYRVVVRQTSAIHGPVKRIIPADKLKAPADGDIRFCLWDAETDELTPEEAQPQ